MTSLPRTNPVISVRRTTNLFSRVVYTDPHAAAVGATESEYDVTVPLSEVPKTATHTPANVESNGLLTLLSDGTRLTGAYALGPEGGEWLQQATLAIRARVRLAVLMDTMQPFPSFSGIYDSALKELSMAIADMRPPVRPMAAQMSTLGIVIDLAVYSLAYTGGRKRLSRSEWSGHRASDLTCTSLPAGVRSPSAQLVWDRGQACAASACSEESSRNAQLRSPLPPGRFPIGYSSRTAHNARPAP